ncbi:MAG: choice-of-anchor tandem repeat GloVer-containing protein [Terriglobales bacterium]
MRVTTKFALTFAVLFFGLLLAPRAVLAQGTNCPPEPASGTPITDGEIYIGTNCTLTSPGDVDGFVFTGNSGETYHLVLAINGSASSDICITLLDPHGVQIFSHCTQKYYGVYSVAEDQALTTTGTYTVNVTENSPATVNYAFALERLYPFPPNAQEISLAMQYPGDITPITDSNAFTFPGATTGMERVSATLTGSPHSDLCMNVYLQNGTLQQSKCTQIYYGVITIQIDFTPTENGISMAFFQVNGNDGTDTYTMEVSCLQGMCIPTNQGFNMLSSLSSPVGAHPSAGMVQIPSGDFYGTTAEGGTYNAGTVFKIHGGTVSTVYSFCMQNSCGDGYAPQGGLALANDGNLYGTTSQGGANNYGTVFKITTSGTLTTLFNFDSTHGANPLAGLISGNDGNLYGTTANGGAHNRGTVFKIGTSPGTPTVLYSFCANGGACSDGLSPHAGVIQGGDGNFYGTTYGGGSHARGTIFQLTPAGTLTTLFPFDSTHGAYPEAGLIQANDGNLYGTTYGDGAHKWGTIFKSGTSPNTLTTLYSFASSDGANPAAGLVQANDENFYGTTSNGGPHARGTIFQITSGGALTTLYGFDSTHGANPKGVLIQGIDGNLYGTTYGGGADFGTVFSQSLP